jgi:hypothetical protein
MRRMTLVSMLCTLAMAGCFDDAVTLGLGCENDRECGEGQACGPGELEDNGSPTPAQICGVPQDEGWDECLSSDPPLCGDDFETALVCINGFRTQTDCDVVCESVEGPRHDGVCGRNVSDTTEECACAYAVDDAPEAAKDCIQTDAGLDVVRFKDFGSDDVAVYLQTCDEWCKEESPIPTYAQSACVETFVDSAASAIGAAFANAVLDRLNADEPCVCRLEEPADCAGDQPATRCLGSSTVVVCTEQLQAQILCSERCESIEVGNTAFDICL